MRALILILFMKFIYITFIHKRLLSTFPIQHQKYSYFLQKNILSNAKRKKFNFQVFNDYSPYNLISFLYPGLIDEALAKHFSASSCLPRRDNTDPLLCNAR